VGARYDWDPFTFGEKDPDRRINILELLQALEIPLSKKIEDSEWRVEVAYYRDGEFEGTGHSHAKFLVVDGKEAIVSGFNIQDWYLGANGHDTAVHVSGTVATETQNVFDYLWTGAIGLCLPDDPAQSELATIDIETQCENYRVYPLDHAPIIRSWFKESGDDVPVFSLYRDSVIQDANTAILSGINAASDRLNLRQKIFTKDLLGFRLPFAQAIIDAINDQDVDVFLLAAADGRDQVTPDGKAVFGLGNSPGSMLAEYLMSLRRCPIASETSFMSSSMVIRIT